MSLTQDLRQKHDDLWQKMVNHPFVVEMGDGTLPVEKFSAYFIQDYIFVRDLVVLIAQGVSKAPDLQAAARLNSFLADILNPENDLFVRAFKELGVSEPEYISTEASPTTQAFGDFLVRVGLDGDFCDIATVLYVTEGTYLDWATRMIEAGKSPANPVYREWLDIHGPEVLGGLVDWLAGSLDLADTAEFRPRAEKTFLTALRYEYLFWEAAYSGEAWPDQ